MKTKKVNMISDSEWDKLVEDTYKRPYAFQQQDGCRDRGIFSLKVPDMADDFENDTVPEFINHKEKGVSFKAWLERDPKAPLKDGCSEEVAIKIWWERNFYPDVQMIANDLHRRGLLDAGEHVINMDW